MIAEPINDAACLGQLTAIARAGVTNAEIKTVAARFRSTASLTRWIRGLPQRDDTGRSDDGPRVMCDVGQRARLVADDPNCVERAILYLAAAEVIDPGPVRQLATVDLSATLRHTFPVEDAEPVVLDPQVRRNALRACVWQLRNGGNGSGAAELDGVEAAGLLHWLLDLAHDVAEEESGERGVRRVERARRALDELLAGRRIHPRDRAHLLYAVRLAGEVAPWFGELGREGYRLARRLVARVVTIRTVGAASPRNLSAGRAVYWGGKTIATVYGVGGLYDAAYNEVARRPSSRPRDPERALPRPPAPVVVTAAIRSEGTEAPPALVLGTLGELEGTKGK